ncbi:MAG TPA: bifunctional helix-turn-helix transcriptional regulator/GNAT family N-acetyltransferase [Gaiella sp.]|nr:bifunctional helix-turn-helix transcriptional regulator/GNAT family N-acetyltransferase [Gaiella sp.]
MLEQVRSFNRVVTQSIGALHDRYLSSSLPLGEARVLWEIGDGCEVRELRARLDLDSGYLSRLLRSLEGARLVTVRPSPLDRRVRSIHPTTAGRRERDLLDRRSDDLAASLIGPLSEAQRERLAAAMAEVERLLTAGLVRIDVVDPEDPAAVYCLREYYAELARRFDDGWDDAIGIAATPEQLRPPSGLFALATLHGAPVGCGALKFHGRRPAELKRMWVAPSTRGLGLGRRLLAELEGLARDQGARTVRLETNRNLKEAIALYRAAGYREVLPFNDEPYAHHWFEKRL